MPPSSSFTAEEEVCNFFQVCLVGMLILQDHSVFDDGVVCCRQAVSSLDCCSFNVSLWLFSAFTSACILMMPGVISPGGLLDVDVEMLKSVLK